LKYYTTGESIKLLKKYIIIPITNVCNLSCGGCNQLCGNYPKKSLWFIELDELKKNINIVANNTNKKRIGLFGGEPTLHPKFNEVLELCYEFKELEFLVYTNGRAEVKDHKNIKYNISPKCHPLIGEQVRSNIKHFPTLVAAIDILKSEDKNFYWEKAKKDCNMWNNCGAIIYRDRAYFCEIAGAMDQLFEEQHGWEIEEGVNPFVRTDQEIKKQASHYCYRCGWCAAKNCSIDKIHKSIPKQNLDAPYLITKTNFENLKFPKKNILEIINP